MEIKKDRTAPKIRMDQLLLKTFLIKKYKIFTTNKQEKNQRLSAKKVLRIFPRKTNFKSLKIDEKLFAKLHFSKIEIKEKKYIGISNFFIQFHKNCLQDFLSDFRKEA